MGFSVKHIFESSCGPKLLLTLFFITPGLSHAGWDLFSWFRPTAYCSQVLTAPASASKALLESEPLPDEPAVEPRIQDIAGSNFPLSFEIVGSQPLNKSEIHLLLEFMRARNRLKRKDRDIYVISTEIPLLIWNNKFLVDLATNEHERNLFLKLKNFVESRFQVAQEEILRRTQIHEGQVIECPENDSFNLTVSRSRAQLKMHAEIHYYVPSELEHSRSGRVLFHQDLGYSMTHALVGPSTILRNQRDFKSDHTLVIDQTTTHSAADWAGERIVIVIFSQPRHLHQN